MASGISALGFFSFGILMLFINVASSFLGETNATPGQMVHFLENAKEKGGVVAAETRLTVHGFTEQLQT